ncbi:Protein transport protein Sec24C [Zancudomyces culisetae]|uniref:Protein transport protein Sec24C n=1 Tax=Zancudomyces culisetae TaxID=1213189 RepID=A0A1R1PQM6_ZANCU|nr:Protein transport protein Sec24C [Zancudomyces culisetae]|eukprot:OMH83270.1 Protein transport protein Sec24C [Zancudomyces culisetae]
MFTPAGQAPKPSSPFVGGPRAEQMSPPERAVGAEQQKRRIDPNQMPSPVVVHAQNQELYPDQTYYTSQRTGVPMVNTDVACIDEGNANPKFMRMTMYTLPNTDDLLKGCQLPLGAIVQPLADVTDRETPVQVIDFGEEGPVRCLRCKAYINGYMKFIDGGKKFICNLCKHENDVPMDYFYNLDMTGRRMDWEMRPELRNGSIEFVATKEFMSKQKGEAAFVFAIDVTWNAVQSGMLAVCAKTIKEILYSGLGLLPGVRIGLLTYDRSVHFYSLHPSLDQAQMMVVPDLNDAFVPISEGFLVDPIESRHVIEPLLENLPSMFSQNRTAEPAMGAVTQVVLEALKGRGGKLFMFQTALPTLGPGSLKNRDDAKLHNTDKEKTLYVPQDSFYTDTAIKYVEQGIGVNLYLFPNAYTDVATISQLSTLTSGELYTYPSFQSGRDGIRFAEDLRNDALRMFGFNGVLRIRCSDGLRIEDHYGNLYMRNHVDVELAMITCDTSIGVTFKHDAKLDEKEDVYFQVALLYTTFDGQRRIRVHNIALPCTTLVGNMFRQAEIDSSVNLLCRIASAESKSISLRNIRDKLTDRCIHILSAYRTHCAANSSSSQLILPEAYKLLPIYALALTKSYALRSSPDIQLDTRVSTLLLFNQLSVLASSRLLYPRISSAILPSDTNPNLNPNADADADADPDSHPNTTTLPYLVRASYSLLDSSNIYFSQSNHSSLTCWIGRNVDSSVLSALFGTPSIDQIDPTSTSSLLFTNTSPQSVYAWQVAFALVNNKYILPSVADIEAAFSYSNNLTIPKFQIIRQNLDQSEASFAATLVEDRSNDAMSYVDYLCHIHRNIQTDMRMKAVDRKY